MPELTPEIVDSVVAACQAGAEEAAEALGRALDGKLKLAVGEASVAGGEGELAGQFEGQFDAPGLVVMLQSGERAAMLLLPAAGGIVPEWTADPDLTGQSKLTTLAQELGMLLLPEDLMPEQFECRRVEQLSKAVSACQPADELAVLPLSVDSQGGEAATARLVWPLMQPGGLSALDGSATEEGKAAGGGETPSPEEQQTAAQKATQTAASGQAGAGAAPSQQAAGGKPAGAAGSQSAAPSGGQAAGGWRKQRGIHVLSRPNGPPSLRDLPPYTRSLLRVKVPLIVTLASKKQPLGRIVELGPGSIIQFDKSCEEMLDLHVGERLVAQGEAVKVGDKFGLRVTNMILPDERFQAIHRVKPEELLAGAT